MKDVEKTLEDYELSAPSQKQDERMTRLFADPPLRKKFVWPRVALWQCAVACMVCVLIGFWLGGENPTREIVKETHVVYTVEVPQDFRGNVFDWTQYEESETFLTKPKTIVKQIGTADPI
jgi:hypothetical protein